MHHHLKTAVLRTMALCSCGLFAAGATACAGTAPQDTDPASPAPTTVRDTTPRKEPPMTEPNPTGTTGEEAPAVVPLPDGYARVRDAAEIVAIINAGLFDAATDRFINAENGTAGGAVEVWIGDGCNRGGGMLQVGRGGMLRLTDARMTLMACPGKEAITAAFHEITRGQFAVYREENPNDLDHPGVCLVSLDGEGQPTGKCMPFTQGEKPQGP